MESKKRKRKREAAVLDGGQNEDATDQPKSTTKRSKPNSPTEPKKEKSIGWFNYRLSTVQRSAGFPESQSISKICHASLLTLPLQPNVLTPETIHCHYQRPPWTSSYPVPLVTHPFEQLDRTEWIEPLLRLYRAKVHHSQTLNRLKASFDRRKVAVRKRIGGRRNLYPTTVVRVAEELERDPDRWFTEEAGYDYYFTGGNLAVIIGTQFRWLINTVGELMNIVEFVPFEWNDSQLNVLTEQAERFELDEGGPVFEIQHKQMSKTGQHYHVALRRKFQIDVLLLNAGHQTMKSHPIPSKEPFISCCFLPGTDDTKPLLCTSNLQKTITVVEYLPKKYWQREYQLEKFSDNDDDCWTCLRPFGQTSFFCLDRKSIKFMKLQDNRLKLDQQSPLATWLWPCEKATCLEFCPEGSLLLIGTTHKLLILQFDDRETQPEFQQVLTFTHNLQFHLTMIRYRVDAAQKQYYVHLSSHMAGDTMICTFSKVPPKRFTTKYLPVKPLTIQESVHMARTKGKCLYPAVVLQNRLKLYHSGIEILVDDANRFHLLVQNSLGDIYHQRLDPGLGADDESMDAVATQLQTWMIQLRDMDSTQCPVGHDYKNLRGLRNVFRAESLNAPKAAPDAGADDTLTPNRKRHPRWCQTVEQMHQYKDLLAGPMLSIWGFRPDVTESQRQSQSRRLGVQEPISVEDRIADWLDATAVGEAEIEEIDAMDTTIVKEESQLHMSSYEEEERTQPKTTKKVVEEIVSVPPVVVKIEPIDTSVQYTSQAAKGKSTRKKYVQGF